MPAAIKDLNMEQGSDFEMVLTMKNALGNPFDITGFVFTGQLRANYSAAQPVAVFSFQILDQTVTENLGKVRVYIGNAETSAIPVPVQNAKALAKTRPDAVFAYDIESSIGGSVKRIMQGVVNVSPEVTRV